MRTGVIIAILIVLAIVLVAIFAFNSGQKQENQGSTSGEGASLLVPAPGSEGEGVEEMIVNEGSQGTQETLSGPQTFTVEYTSSGFNPATLEVNSGDTVTWTNTASGTVWPASDPHPTHTAYAGFDANKGLKNGESYSFTFNKVGSWSYHNHLSPSQKGTIIVQG